MTQRYRNSDIVSQNGVRIETYVDGNGPALVILPSYGRDGGEDFDAFADLAAKAGWRVLRPQPRGVGNSTGPINGVDLPELAADVAHVIRSLAGGRAIVLGHAFGNFVGRVLATEHGRLVSAIILAAASASKVADDINATPFIAGDPSRPEAQRLDALRKAFFAPGHDPRIWLAGWYPETLMMQRAAVEATTVKKYWSAGAAPLLEIIPRHDPFKPQLYWRELSDQLGDRVTTAFIDDASHALFPEQPDRVAQTVLPWIESFREITKPDRAG
jgi:pimeloyl-ACP methyl ester carboxylesterase